MPLHIDYRPNDFKFFVGNEGTVKSIQTLLARENKDYPHAWLFQGPSGTGKTTLARIVAKRLGCDIDTLDFTELDIAQLTGIDTAREIQSSMAYRPSHGSSVRVFLLDEVHMASRNFQNGLLQALEDTPQHVFFLLCTTEPKKLIPTVRNRCTAFSTALLPTDETIKLLDEVIAGEGLDQFDIETLEAIAEASQGSPRDALTILDKVLDLEPDERIAALDKSLEQKQTIDLCRALLKEEAWGTIAAILKDITDEPEKVRQAVNGYMSAVLLGNKQISPRAINIMMCFDTPNFNDGKPGLVRSCAMVYYSG